jgi:hypothetical protein
VNRPHEGTRQSLTAPRCPVVIQCPPPQGAPRVGHKKRPPLRVAWNFEFLERLLLDVDALLFRLRNRRLNTKLVDGADG